jgi:hypothetical protein
MISIVPKKNLSCRIRILSHCLHLSAHYFLAIITFCYNLYHHVPKVIEKNSKGNWEESKIPKNIDSYNILWKVKTYTHTSKKYKQTTKKIGSIHQVP